jgi:hypothetical protein
LWNGIATRVKELQTSASRLASSLEITNLLEIRLAPSGIKPVTRIGRVLASLLCDGIVVLTSTGEIDITGSWLRGRDVVVVEE